MTASDDGTAKLFDAGTGVCERTFYGHAHELDLAAFTTSGAKVLISSEGGDAKMFDAETGNQERAFQGHLRGMRLASITPVACALGLGAPA